MLLLVIWLESINSSCFKGRKFKGRKSKALLDEKQRGGTKQKYENPNNAIETVNTKPQTAVCGLRLPMKKRISFFLDLLFAVPIAIYRQVCI